MVSSAALPRVRRTMGDELGLPHAEAFADVADIGVDDLVHVAKGVGEVAQAFLRLGPVCWGREDFQCHAARVPADAAIGLAPEGVVEAGFGEREKHGEAVAEALACLCKTHGFPRAGHREDDRRPEAGEKPHQCGHVSQQP